MTRTLHLLSVLTLLPALNSQLSPLLAQGTALTYQGQLSGANGPANGNYDLTFTLFDTDSAGVVVAGPITNSATLVSNGLFTATIDFGFGVFSGNSEWLEIAVQTNGGSGFATLTPRQLLTPAPYAIYSANAGHADTATQANQASNVLLGAISVPQLNTTGMPAPGQVLGYNGTQLVWQDPVIGGSTGGWSLAGNLGTIEGLNFLGTSDSKPLELKAGGVRALRLEPDATGTGAPNFIGGSPANYVSNTVVGATIAGGGAVNYSNSVTASFGMIGGGVKNIAGGQQSFVGGGFQNTASGYISTVAGGAYNTASLNEAAVVGGDYNVASGSESFVGGGAANVASGTRSVVGGGGYKFSFGATLGNTASGNYSVVGGGDFNAATQDGATVSGGTENSAAGINATVVGGWNNNASGSEATVAGGYFNTASGDYSFAAGDGANALHRGAFVWADSQLGSFSSTAVNQFLLRAAGGVGIGTAQTPPGGLRVGSGGLAVTGASSPNYPGSAGVFIERIPAYGGAVFAYDYNTNGPLPLALNSPGGNVGIGTLTPQYTLDVNGTTRTHSIIITGGADLAEPFKTGADVLPKGTVVVIDAAHPGDLAICRREYDTRVAGIVSGANGVNPGITLRQEGALEVGQNVALSGRVYALADADAGSIEPGDLLTTSATPGHAMKVNDANRARGAIIGKAMTGLNSGKGMILVLVTLQ